MCEHAILGHVSQDLPGLEGALLGETDANPRPVWQHPAHTRPLKKELEFPGAVSQETRYCQQTFPVEGGSVGGDG